MDGRHVITISREYGSGGRIVGKKLAELLDVPFYDRIELEKLTVGEDFSDVEMEQRDEKDKNSFIFNISASLGFTHDVDKDHFKEQQDKIEEIYEQGSCVIVGRCADYILRDRPDVTSIYMFASEKARADRAVKEYGVEPKEAYRLMDINDRTRENYYRHFTGRKWGDARNYHLSINTEHIDTDSLVQLIARYVELRG